MPTKPLSLFFICCDLLVPVFEKIGRGINYFRGVEILEELAAVVAEALLDRAITTERNNLHAVNNIWKEDWKVFLTRKIRYASISWDEDIIKFLISPHLKLMKVTFCQTLDTTLFQKIPKSVEFVIFEINERMAEKEERRSWLSEAQEMLKLLLEPSRKFAGPTSGVNLTEVDLGCVAATSADLQAILSNSPSLRNLRHYQLVKALYDLHVHVWKKREKLPLYKLKNLDIDFSHVVRCRMSPEWVLAPDALQLATMLCPEAVEINLRFDCSTPNDVLTPLLTLEQIKKFSAVCVTSGERTNLDFSDMVPILEKYGPITLTFLELKVIEEVEVHVIIEWCTKVETLILSGCGYVTPPTCASYTCEDYRPGTFYRLRHLFFADGDDFSWDHGTPECFWKASLLPSVKQKGIPLEGLFLEFPRIPEALTETIFRRSSDDALLPFPELKIVSFCRYSEVTLADIVSMCGLEKATHPPIHFLRLSECDQWEPLQEKKLQNLFKQKGIECEVFVDSVTEGASEQKRPYSYKIKR